MRILVGVHTSPLTSTRRDAIRNTWAAYNTSGTLVCFIVGLGGLSPEVKQSLLSERMQHGDLVFFPTVEDGHCHISMEKAFSWWWWAAATNVPHIARVDDDTFLHLPNLQRLLQPIACHTHLVYGVLAFVGYNPHTFRKCGFSWRGDGNWRRYGCAATGSHEPSLFASGMLQILSLNVVKALASSTLVKTFVERATLSIDLNDWDRTEDVALGYVLTQLLMLEDASSISPLVFVRAEPKQAHNLGCQKHDALYRHPKPHTSVAIHYVKKPSGFEYIRKVLDGEITHGGKACTRAAGVGRRLQQASSIDGVCSAFIGGRPPTAPTRLRWLHFPKAGTSFANTILHTACPKAPHDASVAPNTPPEWPPIGLKEHYARPACIIEVTPSRPHEPARYPRDVGTVIALFRSPRARLTSSWSFLHAALQPECLRDPNDLIDRSLAALGGAEPRALLHSHGIPLGLMKAYIANGCSLPIEYLLRPDIRNRTMGVQSKLSLGLKPGLAVSDERVQRAWKGGDGLRRRLQSAFAFVGLTERWADTICLFHARFGGVVRAVELRNNRPTSGLGVKAALPEALLSDPMDEAAYQMVLERFEADVRRFQKKWEVPGTTPQS